MRVLVTGGTGYLGGRIVEYLTKKGIYVSVCSRDVFVSDESLDAACHNITAIIHLAAMNAQECAKAPEALMVNGLNSLRLLNAAKRMGVSKFIYFSTAHVYGSPLVAELDEKSLPRPMHHYSITHRVAEDYVLEASARGEIFGVVFRLTNAVGSPVSQDANCWMLVVNDLCRQAVVDKKMVLLSDQSVLRDYLPISSVTAAIFFMLGQSIKNNSSGEIYNLSSGATLTLRDITDLIVDRTIEVLGFRPEVDFSSKRERENGGVEQFVVLNSKLKVAGFNIETDIENEIDQLLLNCRNWLYE